jgi:hypothetical protein
LLGEVKTTPDASQGGFQNQQDFTASSPLKFHKAPGEHVFE